MGITQIGYRKDLCADRLSFTHSALEGETFMTTHVIGRWFHFAVLFVAATLASCATTAPPETRFCESSELLVDSSFEGGRFYSCTIDVENEVSIVIHPEDEPPINPSPWYSFRISSKLATNVEIKLAFVNGYARYWPKVSADGENWLPMADESVRVSEDGQSLSISMRLEHTPMWISAQELVLPSFYSEWLRQLSMHPEVVTQALGRSVQGRPIYVAKTQTRPEAIILIGRQHPPEVSGALAMKSFVNTIMSDSKLANDFRNRYSIIMIPLINPDGVVLGHWRHNINGVDLNRDWGPFTQPETQSVARLLSAMERTDINLRLMLDFHSTKSSLFYTQLPDDSNESADFATVWLSRSRKRLPDFEFKHDPRPPSGQANTKNFFHSHYGIPAITYELGDEVDREEIAATTPVFAEEMMRLLLER